MGLDGIWECHLMMTINHCWFDGLGGFLFGILYDYNNFWYIE
jgi:hypothetical protein